MIEIGYMIGFWLLYALCALIFKHKVGFVVASFLGIISGIMQILVRKQLVPLALDIVACVLIFSIPALQIRSEEKRLWLEKRKLKKENDLQNKSISDKMENENKDKKNDIDKEKDVESNDKKY